MLDADAAVHHDRDAGGLGAGAGGVVADAELHPQRRRVRRNRLVDRVLDGAPVFMAASPFSLKYDEERSPAIRFADVKDYQKRDSSPEGRGRVAPGGATG